ncbi:MAG: M56 family metallopeptidase, partial [Pseudomonadota bacterium]
MLTWALVNTVLSLLALGFALLNQGAPHRLRFHVCFLALVCWLVPWSQVPQLLPNLATFDFGFQIWQAEQQLIASTANATQVPLIVIDTRNVPLANDVTLLHVPLLVLAALLLSGLALFGWNVLQHHWRLRALQRTARDASGYWRQYGIETAVPILLQNSIGGAFSSGVLNPVIWVHDDLATTQELPTLLRHELTHIQQHDNWYLLVITLVEKLLWWNPMAWYLGQQSRHLQELSCDERCRDHNADYPAELAQLMLTNLGISRSVAPEPSLFSANIFNKPNLNIQRLKVLQRSHQMKPRHIVSAVATALLAFTTVGLVTAQPESES